MENFKNANANILTEEYSNDYVNANAFETDEEIRKELYKKKIAIIGLGTFYVLLFVVSFTLLS
ncbi:MAG: hypothetical protein V3V16_05130 [Melioribacteraceae bacterium]